jgi:hypothetical protein
MIRKGIPLLLMLILAGLVGPATSPQEPTLQGDVNGDQVVDGKDALRLFQISEGLVPPTERDQSLGDVFPVRGAGERPFGDGELTREDARQVLRMLVGSVPRGEIKNPHAPFGRMGVFSGSTPPQTRRGCGVRTGALAARWLGEGGLADLNTRGWPP